MYSTVKSLPLPSNLNSVSHPSERFLLLCAWLRLSASKSPKWLNLFYVRLCVAFHLLWMFLEPKYSPIAFPPCFIKFLATHFSILRKHSTLCVFVLFFYILFFCICLENCRPDKWTMPPVSDRAWFMKTASSPSSIRNTATLYLLPLPRSLLPSSTFPSWSVFQQLGVRGHILACIVLQSGECSSYHCEISSISVFSAV